MNQEQLNTHLIKSVKNNDIELVRQYLEMGAVPTSYNFELVEAMRNNNVEIIKLLVSHGKKITDYLMNLCAGFDSEDVLKYIAENIDNFGIKEKSRDNLVEQLAEKGNIEMLHYLFDKNWNLSAAANSKNKITKKWYKLLLLNTKLDQDLNKDINHTTQFRKPAKNKV